MATVSDLLILQYHVIQLLAADQAQPTVSDITQKAEAGSLIPYLIELSNERKVDASTLSALYGPDSEKGRSVSDAIASAANVIDTQRKYGMGYDEHVGLLALLWYIIDSVPSEARAVPLGF